MLDRSRDLTLVQSFDNRKARETLFNESYEKVVKWIAAKVQPTTPNYREVVHEITQIAFSRAFEKLEAFDGSRPFYYWVCGFANNCLKELWRSKKNTDIPTIDNILENLIPIYDQIPLYGNPEIIFIRKEESEAVRNAFKALSQNYQEILYLRLYLGLKYCEIATELNKSVDSLESLFRRAIVALRKEFHNKS